MAFSECLHENFKAQCDTRMHSSRMRTGRSLTVCCSLLPGGGPVPEGGSPWQGGSGPGGVLPGRGGLVPGGFSLAGGVLPGGGGSPYWRPPPVNRMTNRCKNITLATTSLRPVIIHKNFRFCLHCLQV